MQPAQHLDDATSIRHERLLLTIRRTLPRRDRLFLVLHYLHDLEFEDVASVMECSVDEVRTSIEASMAVVSSGLETGDAAKVHSGC